ncbi:hypothetical protein GQ602_004631 [Ophiocordyceps camponoti-floridani]|uniref:Uncharacterized protein n=1 Tax=Ophiocordyceps camponoti-floridani TaxID=2030778 RepID=A0A8H4Q454_9HYPO|nr:hypothetical protein GQ602_004631 [Ophiocordyceps camponoti-floridani]
MCALVEESANPVLARLLQAAQPHHEEVLAWPGFARPGATHMTTGRINQITFVCRGRPDGGTWTGPPQRGSAAGGRTGAAAPGALLPAAAGPGGASGFPSSVNLGSRARAEAAGLGTCRTPRDAPPWGPHSRPPRASASGPGTNGRHGSGAAPPTLRRAGGSIATRGSEGSAGVWGGFPAWPNFGRGGPDSRPTCPPMYGVLGADVHFPYNAPSPPPLGLEVQGRRPGGAG